MGYTEKDIESPEALQHIRLRPGMYIGKTGNGSLPDDGIYILLKEVMDNAVDEFIMGEGSEIHLTIEKGEVSVRDYGRGIPLTKVVDCASRMLTGAKFGSEAFKRSAGLHGVGLKAVNALSTSMCIRAYRGRKCKEARFSRGKLVHETKVKASRERNGTYISFTPDPECFPDYAFQDVFVERMLHNYAYLNKGLRITWNGKEFLSENGLADLLEEHLQDDQAYPFFHYEDDSLEVVFTHGSQSGDDTFSFVNGQHTLHGGTHEQAFREVYMKTLREFFGKAYDAGDLRAGLVLGLSIRIHEPSFEFQTKTKLGSTHMAKNGETIRQYLSRVLQPQLDNFLHKNKDAAESIHQHIQASERSRKELKGIKKIAKERAKKARIHNRKLIDCSVHFNSKHPKRKETTIFLTEGDSASGPMITARDPHTQAIFSLRGKPLNTFALSKKIVYENEEFYLLQDALNIEDGIEGLRFNRVVLATDADVDGMHIRLLMTTFFLQFFPDLIRNGHLHILQTPLFRVRNKKETRYCYSEEERLNAIAALGPKPEITRFKGLGEISPKEFAQFIGKGIRLDPVSLQAITPVRSMLTYFMGKNTQQRQEYILENLKPETDAIPETLLETPAKSPRRRKAATKPAQQQFDLH